MKLLIVETDPLSYMIPDANRNLLILQALCESIKQTEYLIFLSERWLTPLKFILGSPTQAEIRGSHVSLRHPEGYRINRALIDSPAPAIKVIPDFRAPDNIRLGIAPIYTTFTEVHQAVNRIRTIVEERLYEQYPTKKLAVT